MEDHADGDAGDDGEDVLEALPAIIAVATLGVGVTLVVLGLDTVSTVVFVVGWLLLTPLSAILADTTQVRSVARRLSGSDATARRREHREGTAGEEGAALEELKRRYARGEIDEAEFERRTALLLENESIDDVRDRVVEPERTEIDGESQEERNGESQEERNGESQEERNRYEQTRRER